MLFKDKETYDMYIMTEYCAWKGHNYFHCEVFMIQLNCSLAKLNCSEACLIVGSCFPFFFLMLGIFYHLCIHHFYILNVIIIMIPNYNNYSYYYDYAY